MKRIIFTSLIMIGFNVFTNAQKAAFLVPERVEVEILKDEIKALNQKDANYKSKLTALQKQEKQAEEKATELENILSTALTMEKKAATTEFKSKKGETVIWTKTSQFSAGTAPIKPPGGRPCQPGACLDFLFFLSEECPSCDFSSFEKIRELKVQGKKYSVYKASVKATINTAKYKIAASGYARN